MSKLRQLVTPATNCVIVHALHMADDIPELLDRYKNRISQLREEREGGKEAMSDVATLMPMPEPASELQECLDFVLQPQRAFHSYVDLNEWVSLYCERLTALASDWRHLVGPGITQGQVVKRLERLVCSLDRVSRQLLERSAHVECKRQAVQQLVENLAVSGHAVEARALELVEAEQGNAQRERQQAMHIMAIHRLQREQSELEKRLIPKAKALKEAMDQLVEKEERLSRVQALYCDVMEHCKQDLAVVEQQARDARKNVAVWQDRRTLDVAREVEVVAIDPISLLSLEREVMGLKSKTWGGEALQTKLVHCSRSHQRKQRMAELQRVLSIPEYIVPADSELHGFQGTPAALTDTQRATDLLLTDGPTVTAQQVEDYLSREFGFAVRGDFLLFCRLKEELGRVGLTYLIHKVQDAGSLQADALNLSQTTVFADPRELQQVLDALQDIAFQFRVDTSLTESILDKWNITWHNVLQATPQQHSTSRSVKRGKAQKGRSAGQVAKKQQPAPTPMDSKEKVGSRSSLSRVKRAFGISSKKN